MECGKRNMVLKKSCMQHIILMYILIRFSKDFFSYNISTKNTKIFLIVNIVFCS